MTDYNARQRIISEIASSAGLSADRVATEVLFYLPPDFLRAYEELFWNTFKPQGSIPIASEDSNEKLGRSKGGKLRPNKTGPQGPSVQGGGKRYKEFWVIISDKNYRKKQRIDQKLKELALTLQDKGIDSKGCSGCGKFTSPSHNYCSGCGTKIKK